MGQHFRCYTSKNYSSYSAPPVRSHCDEVAIEFLGAPNNRLIWVLVLNLHGVEVHAADFCYFLGCCQDSLGRFSLPAPE